MLCGYFVFVLSLAYEPYTHEFMREVVDVRTELDQMLSLAGAQTSARRMRITRFLCDTLESDGESIQMVICVPGVGVACPHIHFVSIKYRTRRHVDQVSVR